MIRATLITTLAALALAACASGPKRPPPSASDMLGEVGPRQLRDDQCSMILYTRGEPSTRVLVAVNAPAEASARIGARDRTLTRTEQSGAALLGHSEVQTWTWKDGEAITASVRFDFLPSDPTGAVIRSASLSYTNTRGETLVIPVVGLVSCGAAAG